MSESIQASPPANRALLAQRSAQLEQQLNRVLGQLKSVPLRLWQWLLALLLVLWLSQSLAQLVWLLVPAPQIPTASIALSAPAGAAAGSQSDVDIQQLSNLEPFGKVQVAPAPAEQPTAPAGGSIEDDASDTQLNLVLRGVLASNDEVAARAVIASGDRQEVFAIGDKLPVGNNVTLAKVLDLRVIINNNGKYESLWLFKDDAGGIASSGLRPMPQVQAPATTFRPPTPNTRPQPLTGPQPEVGPGLGGDQRLAEMNTTLSDVVNMRIHRENGAVVGYKINPGRNAELFHSLGLQAEDVVTAVNGTPLDSPGKLMEIYKNLNNATSANLQINRGGSVINLDIVLN